MQIKKLYLIILTVFLLSSCDSIKESLTNPSPTSTQTDTPVPTFTASPTFTITPTVTPTRTATPTQTSTITSTPTIVPTMTSTTFPSTTPIFYEDFSNITQDVIEEKFIVQCDRTFLDINSVGLYSIRVKEQVPNEGYCVLIPKVNAANGIQKAIIKVHYISGNSNTYTGFYNKCGEVVVGYWINMDRFIYSNKSRKFEMLTLTPTQDDYHEISVVYGEKIQISVDGQAISSDELAKVFECPGYPSSIAVGVWVQPQFSVSANLDEILIWGR